MANAIPVRSARPQAEAVTPAANGQVVNGLMAPGTDEIVKPTNYLEAGRLLDERDLGTGARGINDVDVVVPLKALADGSVPVLSHKATRKDN